MPSLEGVHAAVVVALLAAESNDDYSGNKPLQTNPQLASVVEAGHGIAVVRIVYKIGALGGTVACEKQKEKRTKIKKKKRRTQ